MSMRENSEENRINRENGEKRIETSPEREQNRDSAAAAPPGPWTRAQRRAIDTSGRDLLVAAGAGSGKTRVLVERILQRIAGESQGLKDSRVDIDRFLIVTFTNAAAAEMKHRIAAGLKKILTRRPGETHLRRQLLLLNRAQISTIHSFCMDVIRRYAYLRSMDTAFRIVDENEAALLRYEALEGLLEQCYREHDPGGDFYRLVDLFSTDRGDRALQDLVLRLYDFSRSHPCPASWLQEQVEVFATLEPRGSLASPWEEILLQQVRQELAGMVWRLERALELTGYPGGPEPYVENLEDDLAVVRQSWEASGRSWDELARAVQAPAFGRLKSCRGDRYDPGLKDQVSALRNSCKDDFSRLIENYFQRPLEEQREELKSLAPVMKALVDLVLEFGGVYETVKREKSLADFSDLEHRALELLTHPDSGGAEPRPSEAALDYRRKFVQVLVDEYQDINPVQEAILQRVAVPAPRGNRFMVGDVKQSIYRFRLAEPALFQEKYRRFQRIEEQENAAVPPEAGQAGQDNNADPNRDIPGKECAGAESTGDALQQAWQGGEPGEPGESGECIVLSQNFRSRAQVLDGVNDLFSRLMDEEVGEVDYDDEARLYQGTDFPTPPVPVEFYLVDREGGGGIESPEEQEAQEELAGPEELGKAELEGRLIAQKIQEMMGRDSGQPLQIYDREEKQARPVRYRDMVVLLRSARNWAPPILETLREAGIPAYVDLGTGYFSATEVEVILSLLNVIDNPFQDIPLGAVLRSPLVGLNAGELAALRAARPAGPFFEAVKACSGEEGETERETGSPEKVQSETGGADAEVPESEQNSGGAAENGGDLAEGELPGELQEKIRHFLARLYRWQDMSRQESLAALVWDIYRETGYYDFVGGLPGGRQRQANLRALFDRARQYEAARFRGLFRFLRFIDQVRERGGDLGEARALGEQEDVVRIMTVHKSKGLEFPVVFAAGLGKSFNLQDTSGHFLVHKSIGFGPRYLDLEKRVAYPTLAWHAVRQRLILETLSEEMRILYVALTRAEERLILVGSVRDAGREVEKWARAARGAAGAMLSTPDRAAGRCVLDWIGPVLLQHPDAEALRALCPEEEDLMDPRFRSSWKMDCITPAALLQDQAERQDAPARAAAEETPETSETQETPETSETQEAPQVPCASETQPLPPAAEAGEEASRTGEEREWSSPLAPYIARLEPLPGDGGFAAEVRRRLEWQYPYTGASEHLAKLTVSELKKVLSAGLSGEDSGEPGWSPGGHAGILQKRPAFLGRKKLSPGERGSAYHAAMQHLSLGEVSSLEAIEGQLDRMQERGMLTPEEREAVQAPLIAAFFQSSLGRRVLSGKEVYREVPFSLALSLQELYRGGPAGRPEEQPKGQPEGAERHRTSAFPELEPETAKEQVLVQGVIDCLVQEEAGFVLVDFKTGSTASPGFAELLEHYKVQLAYYARAVEQIWREPVSQCFLYFFDDQQALEVKT